MQKLKDVLRELGKKHPDKWAEVVSGYKLFPYQRRFLLDNSKRIVFVSGRQVGKSLTTALKALWRAWVFPDQVVLIVAPTLRQSRLLYEKVRGIIIGNPVIEDDAVKLTMSELVFENGSRIHVLPGSPENIRGFTADMVIVDEAAFVPDDVFAAIEPSLAVRDGQLILISTPFEPSGYLYRAWVSDGWSKHHVSSLESPLISREWVEEFRRNHSEIEFRREILGEFVSSGEVSLFPFDVVVQAMKIKNLRRRPMKGYEYVLGVDIARFGSDYTAIAMVGRKVGCSDCPFEVHGYLLRQRSSLSFVIGWLRDVISRWNPLRVAIDTIGLGAGVFDVLRDEFGDLVIPVEARGKERTEMYFTAKRLLEDGKLLLPSDDIVLSHFMNFEVRYSASGQPRVVKKQSGHDDIADAIVYALYGWQHVDVGRVFVPDFDLDSLLKAISGGLP